MTDLEKIKNWLETYPGHDLLNQFSIDYTDNIPGNGGIFPDGLQEVGRKENILGQVVEVQNQLNFGLYYRLQKAPGDDTGAAVNADWLMDFQAWVQEQSCRRLAPTFGDDPSREHITAQNGSLFDTDVEGTALYMVQLSVTFYKRFT